jgi:beta-galactosidase
VLVSYDNLWASHKDRGAPDFSNVEVLRDLYRPLAERGVAVDLVSPLADLSARALVVIPLLGLIDEEISQSLVEYVDGGGTLLVAPRTGRYDLEGRLRPDRPPGPLAGVCGIEVTEYDVLLEGRANGVRGEAIEASSRWWCDLIETTTAETLAVYTSGFYAGRPAVTWNRSGEGGAMYLGTYLDERGCRDLLHAALERAGIQPSLSLPPGCEAQRRHGLTFLFNHTDTEKIAEVPEGLVDALSGEPVAGRLDLNPDQVLVLKDGRP